MICMEISLDRISYVYGTANLSPSFSLKNKQDTHISHPYILLKFSCCSIASHAVSTKQYVDQMGCYFTRKIWAKWRVQSSSWTTWWWLSTGTFSYKANIVSPIRNFTRWLIYFPTESCRHPGSRENINESWDYDPMSFLYIKYTSTISTHCNGRNHCRKNNK